MILHSVHRFGTMHIQRSMLRLYVGTKSTWLQQPLMTERTVVLGLWVV